MKSMLKNLDGAFDGVLRYIRTHCGIDFKGVVCINKWNDESAGIELHGITLEESAAILKNFGATDVKLFQIRKESCIVISKIFFCSDREIELTFFGEDDERSRVFFDSASGDFIKRDYTKQETENLSEVTDDKKEDWL